MNNSHVNYLEHNSIFLCHTRQTKIHVQHKGHSWIFKFNIYICISLVASYKDNAETNVYKTIQHKKHICHALHIFANIDTKSI